MDSVSLTSSVSARVNRGVNDMRLGVLGLGVGVGMGAAGVSSRAGSEVAAPVGVAATLAAAELIRWRRSRHLLMEAAHRLTGR